MYSISLVTTSLTFTCSGRVLHGMSGCGCNALADTPVETSFMSSSFLACSGFTSSLPQRSTLIRLFFWLVSSLSESWVIALLFLFLCVLTSDKVDPLWGAADATLWKQLAHPPALPVLSNRWDRSLSLLAHCALKRGFSLSMSSCLFHCVTKAVTQVFDWVSCLRHSRRLWTVEGGRIWRMWWMNDSRFCLNIAGKRHTKGLLQKQEKC